MQPGRCFMLAFIKMITLSSRTLFYFHPTLIALSIIIINLAFYPLPYFSPNITYSIHMLILSIRILIQKYHHRSEQIMSEEGHQQLTACTSNQNQLSIADMLLKQLEDEYQEVQRYDRKEGEHQGEYNDEGLSDGEQGVPQGYQQIGDNIDDDSESQTSQENNNDRNKEQNHQNPETSALIQVGPVPESVFEVPKDEQKQIQSDKIKAFALQMDVKTPNWANDPVQFQKRIKQLFQMKMGPNIQ